MSLLSPGGGIYQLPLRYLAGRAWLHVHIYTVGSIQSAFVVEAVLLFDLSSYMSHSRATPQIFYALGTVDAYLSMPSQLYL